MHASINKQDQVNLGFDDKQINEWRYAARLNLDRSANRVGWLRVRRDGAANAWMPSRLNNLLV
jgi:hypothetical protein